MSEKEIIFSRIDVTVDESYRPAVERLHREGFELVGARQDWPGLYTKFTLWEVESTPPTLEGAQPPAEAWSFECAPSGNPCYSKSCPEWALCTLNRYSGTEYPVTGIFFKETPNK